LLAGGVVLGLRQNLALPMLKAQADKAEAQLVAVRRQRIGLARLVDLQTEQALAEFAAAASKQSAAQAALSAGRSWFRSAGLNFGAGVADAKSLVEAYTGYVKTQVDNAQANYELLLSQARVDQVMGRPLAKGESTCKLP
jgi:outer membrane protein TolC